MADNLVSRIYSNFRGVDFRGEEINLVRSPDSLNMWKDYKEIDSIRTRPEMELRIAFDATIHGIWFYKDCCLVHSGTSLYKCVGTDKAVLFSGLSDGESNAFVYETIFYFKDKGHFLRYDGETIKEVEGYVPTTTIGRRPTGGGTKHEDVNMLSVYRNNSFLSDGGSFDYYLDTINIDDDFVPVVTYNDEVVATSEYEVNYAEGKITFLNSAPDAPLTDGQDNVKIKFKKTVPGYNENILNCTLLQLFDNRVFVSGNEDYPNVVWHCSLNDPTYWSDLDYYREGLDSAQIRGLVAGNNALWVFREPSDANTTVFYHTPTIDEEYGKIYPSSHSSVTTGCVGKAINFNDDIVFFSDRGMEGISGDITTEQVVAHRSSLVDRKLITEADYKNMVLEEWEGYLLVFIGKKVYLADSRTAFSNEGHMEYDWFYWELPHKVTCARVEDGILYLGTENGLYTLTGTGDVESYWTTPKDFFKHPHKLKTTNKRGCVAEATGDVTVYARLEEADFEFVGQYMDVTDAFVSRIKRKKFKDIQLKFYSESRFSLETVTLECFIGGYVKRTGVVSYTNPEASKNAAILEDCNEALVEKGASTAETLEQVPQRIGEIQSYADGYDVGYAEGYEQGGDKTRYMTNLQYMYRYAAFPTGYELDLTVADTSALKDLLSFTQAATGLKSVKLSFINKGTTVSANYSFSGRSTSAVDTLELVDISGMGCTFSSFAGTFMMQKVLKKIIGVIDLTGCINTASAFYECRALEEVEFKQGTIPKSIEFNHSPNLTATAIQSIVDGLADLTGATAQTLTLHSVVKNKLTDAQVSEIWAKNWTI